MIREVLERTEALRSSRGGERIRSRRSLPELSPISSPWTSSCGPGRSRATKEILRGDPNARIVMCSSLGQEALVIESLAAREGLHRQAVLAEKVLKVLMSVRALSEGILDGHVRYLDLFLAETREHLLSIEEGCPARRDPANEDTVRELYRHAHSIKGMAASMATDDRRLRTASRISSTASRDTRSVSTRG